jgi:hypothetical protein
MAQRRGLKGCDHTTHPCPNRYLEWDSVVPAFQAGATRNHHPRPLAWAEGLRAVGAQKIGQTLVAAERRCA